MKWYIYRLKTMNLLEIIWRIKQKIKYIYESKKYKNIKIYDKVLSGKLRKINININKLNINYNNKNYTLNTNVKLLGNYKYNKYKTSWNYCFNKNNIYPDTLSYNLNYKNNILYGDARINWELNRHYQFIILSKNYFITKNKKYLKEFIYLFNNYNENNLFLHGISWTSIMEIAIRCNSWTYAYAFLYKTDINKEILNKIKISIINMTDYIYKHYSKYSSANNHLIIESYILLQSGILFNYKKWLNKGYKILNKELYKQNYKDGINKEMSTHYQLFYLEAMGLSIRLLKNNNIYIPSNWYTLLKKMIGYIYNLKIGDNIIIFGDNDEGKILDINGNVNYLEYVLSLYSIILNKQYIKNCNNENINWLYKEKQINNKKNNIKEYNNICYKSGVTILNSMDNKVKIAIDHGNLGYKSIKAHGHADALSFILSINNKIIFIDPGTYVYHNNIEARNYYRKTINHNTVEINNKDQAKILGPFLWGKSYKCKILEYKNKKDEIILKVSHNGYKKIIHTRTFIFNKKNKLIIIDEFNKECNKIINFNILDDNKYVKINYISNEPYTINKIDNKYSPKYNTEKKMKSIRIKTKSNKFITKITLTNI